MPDLLLFLVLITVLAVVLSLLFYQARTGVPPMAASAAEIADVIALLKGTNLPQGAVIYELGSGWGTLAVALARSFPDAKIRGIKISPFPYLIARLRTWNLSNINLQRGDFYNSDLRDADAVTCYLMMKPMPKLAGFLDQMLKPGTPVVALTFGFRGRKPIAVENGPGLRGEAALYEWPAQKL